MKTFVYIGIIGASALLLASCKGKSKPMETPVPSISVSTPIVRDITLTKEYPGYLSSQLKVDLVARVNGYLRTSYLKAGSRVKKGDLIFVIEPDTYQDNVTQAEASVKTSKAQLEYARSNYERMKEAAKSGAVSQIQVIQAEATVSESEAAVKNAEAELNTARTNLSYCYIRAPFDGAVTRASYDIGNYINGAVQPVTLATLYKDDLMFANFNIEDNQFMKMMLEAARNVVDVREYIYDMPLVMAAADLVLCRAGASTIAEIAAIAKPAVLVPSPNVVADHQTKNARVLANAGGAVLLPEGESSGEKLYALMTGLLSDAPRREAMSRALRDMAVPDAAEQIYQTLVRLMEKRAN